MASAFARTTLEKRSHAYQGWCVSCSRVHRRAIVRLRNDGTMSYEVMRCLERGSGLEESWLEI